MAKRRTRRISQLGATDTIHEREAVVLLETLQRLGHVTAGHLREARDAVAVEAREIADRLARLRDAAVQVVRRPEATRRRGWKRATAKSKTAPVSAERMKVMQLQARYLRALRGIAKSDHAKYKAMIPKIGKEATIRKMEAAARK